MGCRPEIFLIRRQFQKRSGTASVKKPVEELLITVNQGIEFMGKGKYHMEVRGIDDLSPALIHPDFLLHSLAVRAVTVTAGIIMDFHVSTVRTLAQIETKPAGFTVYNGMGGFSVVHPSGNAPVQNSHQRNVQISAGFCNHPWHLPAIRSKGLTAPLVPLEARWT